MMNNNLTKTFFNIFDFSSCFVSNPYTVLFNILHIIKIKKTYIVKMMNNNLTKTFFNIFDFS
jgi:hypothetical protein